MKNILLVLGAFAFFTTTVFAQELILNEVSQGPNNQEYVEFVVAGSFSCSTDVCMDLRNVIFDDNNGPLNPNSVSTGAMRFANIDFWGCIPQGTLILIYDVEARNPAIPEDDSSMEDGNYRLILPSNSDLLDQNTTSPNGGLNSSYPAEDAWIPEGNWNTVRMQNGTDLFQVRSGSMNFGSNFSIGWGNANGTAQINFPGSAENRVFSLVNTTSTNPRQQGNWITQVADEGQTPGVPNSNENARWIAEISRNYGSVSELSTSAMILDEQCFSTCDGVIQPAIQGGYAPFSYEWSTGDTTNELSNLCSGEYTLVLTDNKGCVLQDTFQLTTKDNQGLSAFDVPNVLVSGEGIQYEPLEEGGLWSATCGSCIDQNGYFDSQLSGVGRFEIRYVVGLGDCADTTVRIQQVSGHFNKQLPNVFSPNGDGVNDYIDFRSIDYLIKLGSITDRWGNVVYTYTNDRPEWKGTNINGDKLHSGTYFYRFVYKNIYTTEEIEIQGFITILE